MRHAWKTNYCGEILIHAGKQNLTLCMKHETIFEARHMKQAGVFDIELATGAIIGKADLVNCVRIDEAIHRLVREQHIEEDAFGNFSPGRYAWVMENPVLFDTPIPARGRQGLWNFDALLVVWIRLIALAGKCNANGLVLVEDEFPYTDEMLSVIFNKPLQTVKLALATFEKFRMIESTTKGIYITNFDKHQNIEGMDRIRKQNRIRKQRERERKKALLNRCPVPFQKACEACRTSSHQAIFSACQIRLTVYETGHICGSWPGVWK